MDWGPDARPPVILGVLRRQRIERLLAAAWTRRITLLIAGSGYGKTTALRTLDETGRVCRLELGHADRHVERLSRRLTDALGAVGVDGPPATTASIGAEDRLGLAEAQAAILCEAVASQHEDVLLVLDQVEQLADDASIQLVRGLCLQAPPQLHIVLSAERLAPLGLGAIRASGGLLEIAAPDLAFTPEETQSLLDARLGPADHGLAGRVWELTGGWAAALQLLIDRLERVGSGDREQTLARLPLVSGHLWREFVVDLIEREQPEARLALSVATVAPLVDAGLLGALGVADAGAVLESLQLRGLLGGAGDPRGVSGATLSPVLAEILAETVAPEEVRVLRDRAGGWLESQGRIDEALDCRFGGEQREVRSLLERHGHALVANGHGARVAEVLTAVGTSDATELDLVLADALQSIGQWERAIEQFGRVQRAGAGAPLAPAAAWRFGVLLYLRGESSQALEVLDAAHRDDGSTSADALVSAWLSSTLWSRGEEERAAQVSNVALSQADACGDPRARAAAHVAAALAAASSGDRDLNERHYRSALAAAAQAGDAMQLARIRANLSSRALEEGDYLRAVDEADVALSVGAGHRFFAALALCNKADALMNLGELDRARGALAEAIETYSALGSRAESAPHALLGELYRQRGELARARLSFERSCRLAEQAGDAHTLVTALCGLARTTAEDDVEAARDYVARALQRASSLERAQALCASAWVELSAGVRDAAVKIAADADLEARRTDDRPALAEALTLQGLAAQPPQLKQLGDAVDLWHEVGNSIAEQRTHAALAACQGDAATADSLRAELASRGLAPRLIATGAQDAGHPQRSAIAVTTLGRFALARGGENVPDAAWQSRKARDLLKLLAGRRGRPITRDAAAEALWPGDPPGALANRLSVALSTLRKVLDPERTHPPDQFITAHGNSLALRTDTVTVDVVDFLDAAAEAISHAGDEERLHAAERLYTGDFLEGDAYEDWAVDCREAARAAALEVSRLLARAAHRRGDDETASRHLRRLLERDPYDEGGWIALIGAQARLSRHGEARRQHTLYARRMAELDIAPVALARTVDASP